VSGAGPLHGIGPHRELVEEDAVPGGGLEAHTLKGRSILSNSARTSSSPPRTRRDFGLRPLPSRIVRSACLECQSMPTFHTASLLPSDAGRPRGDPVPLSDLRGSLHSLRRAAARTALRPAVRAGRRARSPLRNQAARPVDGYL
jgi:hypothetical protein